MFRLGWISWNGSFPTTAPRLAFHARNTPTRVLERKTMVEAVTVTAGEANKAARHL